MLMNILIKDVISPTLHFVVYFKEDSQASDKEPTKFMT